jgi:hypothetical protein
LFGRNVKPQNIALSSSWEHGARKAENGKNVVPPYIHLRDNKVEGGGKKFKKKLIKKQKKTDNEEDNEKRTTTCT